MIAISAIIFILITHWIADFVFQTNYLAQNKSKSSFVLLAHCVIYSLLFIPFSLYYFEITTAIWFLVITCFLHFYVDYNTSRITSRLQAQGRLGSDTVPNFGMFSIIGLDQLLHYVFLIGTFNFLYTY